MILTSEVEGDVEGREEEKGGRALSEEGGGGGVTVIQSYSHTSF